MAVHECTSALAGFSTCEKSPEQGGGARLIQKPDNPCRNNQISRRLRREPAYLLENLVVAEREREREKEREGGKREKKREEIFD